MQHRYTVLSVIALGSVLLFGAQAATARSYETGMSKTKTAVTKTARADRSRDTRHNGGGRDENRNHRQRAPVTRHDRDRDDRRDRRHDSGHDGYRQTDRRYRDRDYRHPAPGYWRDYHHGDHREYRHRYYNGRHYYYSQAGFFFPGFGFIAHGHVHNRHCPHWHFEPFAAGWILGTLFAH